MKKVVAIILSTTILFVSFFLKLPIFATSVIYGDLNSDCDINNKDLALLMQYINQWNVTIDIMAADVNTDSRINNKDYSLIMQFVNDWNVLLGPSRDNDDGSDNTDTTVFRAEKLGESENIFGEEYILTFIDEFENEDINFDNWKYCPEWERQNRGGKWDNECAYVDEGKLVLSVLYDETEACYKSGAVRTKSVFEQTYGYFECSMRVQNLPGFWCAFWMMCGKPASLGNGGTDGVEIDIAEAFDINSGGINHALHWDRDKINGTQETISSRWYDKTLYDGEFHTYSLSWSPEGYRWYIDGVQTYECLVDDVCNQPGYMKLTVEVGSWAGEIDLSTLPSCVEVDYVRAYQYADILN